jgi:hypothetical protein
VKGRFTDQHVSAACDDRNEGTVRVLAAALKTSGPIRVGVPAADYLVAPRRATFGGAELDRVGSTASRTSRETD